MFTFISWNIIKIAPINLIISTSVSFWSCWLSFFFFFKNWKHFPSFLHVNHFGVELSTFWVLCWDSESFLNAEFFVISSSQPSSFLQSVGSGSNIRSSFKAFAVLFGSHSSTVQGLVWDLSSGLCHSSVRKAFGSVPHLHSPGGNLGPSFFNAHKQGIPFSTSLLFEIPPTISLPLGDFFPALLARNIGFPWNF